MVFDKCGRDKAGYRERTEGRARRPPFVKGVKGATATETATPPQGTATRTGTTTQGHDTWISDAPPSDDDGETAPEVGFKDSDANYTPSEEDES